MAKSLDRLRMPRNAASLMMLATGFVVRLAFRGLRRLFFIAFCLLLVPVDFACGSSFRFAWLSDTHVGSTSGAQDLLAAVQDINSRTGLSFVLISGDITEYGLLAQLRSAREILNRLAIPCHLIPGNHDTKWSESGGTDFGRLWTDDRFAFEFQGYRFIGLHQGPLMRMGDGHWTPQDVRWLEATLKGMADTNAPVIFVTHYPVDRSIDNWYVVLDLLKRYNTQAILCGHGHANRKLSFEGIPGVMGRSNLGTSRRPAGYNLVEVQGGEISFVECLPGAGPKLSWHELALKDHRPEAFTNAVERPGFAVNEQYPGVRERWRVETGYGITAPPLRWKNLVVVADTSGAVRALRMLNGSQQWLFKTKGPNVSLPVAARGRVIIASTDGNIYALNALTGAEFWRFETSRPIVAAPTVHGGRIFVGSSEGRFRALDVGSGKLLWESTAPKGFVETRPLVYRGEVIFGAWDEHLYALNEANGELAWEWKGPQAGVLYSPAACWPVAAKGKVFIVAPDRNLTAINTSNGTQLWRTGDYGVRESIGVSENGSRFYVRSMTNFFHAFATGASAPKPLWSSNAHFGYDINSAMLVEKHGVLFYGTKNGLIFALNSKTGAVLWQHKFSVNLINTLVPVSAAQVLATDADGRIALLKAESGKGKKMGAER